MNCDHALDVAVFLHGKHEPKNNSTWASDALRVADCCRQKSRNDLAIEILDLVEVLPIGQAGEMKCRVEEQRKRITNGNVESLMPIEKPVEQPSLWARGVNFAGAMTRWAGSGFQTRKRDEIEKRLAICQGCEFLSNDACSKCGCPCTGDGVFDKLVIATERCPEGKW